MKIEQRKVRGPQVKQTALLEIPVYTGQAGLGVGGVGGIKGGAKIEPLALLLFLSFGLAHPHTSRMYFPFLAK